ncbi:MAG: BACON domain-containing protein, partial [Bacteroidales bacterium]|nr:BACON domain-containing protein [Bacteroidales bacterium]
MKRFIWALLPITILAIACAKPAPEVKNQLTPVSETTISVAVEGQSIAFEFISTLAWEASTKADWVSVVPVKGPGSPNS